MPFNPNLPLSPRDELRLKAGDIDPENPILSDEVYDHYLEKYSNNVRRAFPDIATTILFYLTRYTRERAGNIEVYGAEWASNYRKALELALRNPNLNAIDAMPYAGGISVTDMQANVDNIDNVKYGLQKENCCESTTTLTF